MSNEDLADVELVRVVVLSNCGLEGNSSKVLAIVRVASISWEAVAKAGISIRVIGGVASSIGISSVASTFITTALVLSDSDLFGTSLAFSTMVPS